MKFAFAMLAPPPDESIQPFRAESRTCKSPGENLAERAELMVAGKLSAALVA